MSEKISNIKCKRCKTEMKIFGMILANGSKMIVEKCPNCGTNANPKRPFLPRDSYNWDKLPLWADLSLNSSKCAVEGCENTGTELHHFAPRSLFNDADNWPKEYLCKYHHDLWHKKTNTKNHS